MRVVCDNCRAVYKIPDDKLLKPVNKATCRSCGHRMLIPRPSADPDERTLVTNNPLLAASKATPEPAMEREEPEHTLPGKRDTPAPSMPRAEGRVPGRRVAGPTISPPDSFAPGPSGFSQGGAPASARPGSSWDEVPEVPLMPGTPMPASERRAIAGRPPPRPTGPPTHEPPEEKTSWVQNPPRPSASGLANDYEPAGVRPSEQPTRINANARMTPEPAPRAAPRPPTPQAPAPAAPSARPESAAAQISPAAAAAPAPSAASPAQISPSGARADAEPRSRRGGTPVSPARLTSPDRASTPGTFAHDPAGDMALALVGTLGALAGVMLLAINVNFGIAVLDTLLRFVALLLAFGGAFTSMLVLLTGARGRRPARRGLALLTGLGFAVVTASAVVGTQVVVEAIRSGAIVIGGQTAAVTPPAPPVEAAVAVTPPEAATTEAEEKEDHTDPPPKEDKPAARAPSSRSASAVSSPSTSSSSSSRPPRVSSSSSSTASAPSSSSGGFSSGSDEDLLGDGFDSPSSRSSTAPPPSTASTRPTTPPPPARSDTMESVPMEVIDVMLRNNIDVKKCFFTHMQANGALPPRVDVRFTLEPSGSVSSAGITQATYAGTDLDMCLGRAIKGIAFPATSGPATKITFPFIFQ